MSTSIGGISFDLVANVARLASDMEMAKKTVGGAMQNIEGTVGFAKKAFVGLTGIVSVGAFVGLIKGTLDAQAALHDLSISTGLSVEALSRYRDVGAMTGTTAESVAAMVNRMAKSLAVANEDSKGAAEAIRALGLDFNTFQKLSPDDQLMAVARAMDQFADGTGKSAVAQALFGREGAKNIPFLQDLARSGAIAARVTAEQAEAADALGDNFAQLQLSGGAWKDELASGMAPALRDATQAMLEIFNGTGGLREQLAGLVQDGTVTEWVRSAVVGLSYVVDALTFLKRGFETVGDFIGAWVAALAAQFGAVGSAAKKAFSGDLSGAWEELKRGARETQTVWRDFAENTKKNLGADTLGKLFRERLEDVRKLGVEHEIAKPRLDLRGVIAGNEQATKRAKEEEKRAEEQKKLLAKAADEAAKAHERQVEALEKESVSLRQQVADQREANAAYGMTAQELAALEVQKLADAAATAERNALVADELDLSGEVAAEYRAQATALRELADLKGQGVHLEAAKEAAAEWKNTTEMIEQGLVDSLFRGFEAGKSFGRNLLDALKAMFKTTVLTPVIQGVMRPVAGAIGGALGSLVPGVASAGTGGMLSGLGGLGGMLGGLGGMAGAGFGYGLAGWGASATLGGTLSGAGAMLTAGTLGSAVAGLAALAGLAAPIVAGVALLKKAFGRGPKQTTGAGIEGEIGGGDVDAQGFTDWVKKGGWLRSDKRGTDYSTLDPEMAAGLDRTAAAVYDQVRGYAAVLGLSADALKTVSTRIRIQLTDDEAKNEKAIEQAFEAYRADLAAKLGPALEPFRKAGEDLFDTLERLVSVQLLTNELNVFGGVFSRIASLSVEAKEELAGFAGGIEALVAKTKGFVDQYYDEAEKFGIGARQIEDQLAALGITGGGNLSSLGDLRKLIESQDVSTSEGRKTFAQLLDIAAQFAPIGKYLEQNSLTLSELADQAPQIAVLESILGSQDELHVINDRIANGVDRLAMSIDWLGNHLAAVLQAGFSDLNGTLTGVAMASAQTARLLDRWDDGDALITRASP